LRSRPTQGHARHPDDADGDFLAEAAIEVRIASRMEGQGKAPLPSRRLATRYSANGDDAVILGRYGDVPDDLAPYTSE